MIHGFKKIPRNNGHKMIYKHTNEHPLDSLLHIIYNNVSSKDLKYICTQYIRT